MAGVRCAPARKFPAMVVRPSACAATARHPTRRLLAHALRRGRHAGPMRRRKEPQSARDTCGPGEARAEHQRERRPVASRDPERQRDERRARRLPDQPRGRDDPARAAARSGGALDISAFRFGDWKKPKPAPHSIIRQPMSTTLAPPATRRATPCPRSATPDRSRRAGRADSDPTSARDGRGERDDDRPRRHQEARLDRIAMQDGFEIERQRHERGPARQTRTPRSARTA